MNVANMMMSPLLQNQHHPTSTFGSQIELPFQLLLEQQVVASTNGDAHTEMPGHDEVLEELSLFFSSLLQLSEEEVIELFGEDAANKLVPEILNWQQHQDDEIELALNEFLHAFIGIFQPYVAESDSQLRNESIPMQTQAQSDALKSVILRLFQWFDQSKFEHETKLNERILFQLQNVERAQSIETSSFKQIKTILTQLNDKQQSIYSLFEQRDSGVSEEKHQRTISQPVIPFQQTAMDRISQLTFRIQLLNETDTATLTKQLERIISSSQIRTIQNGITQLQVRLHPEHLGSLSIKLTQQDGQLLAKITAQTEAAKSLIESQLHQLRHALLAQNVQVEKIEVFVQNNDQQQNNLKSNEDQKQERELAEQKSNEDEREHDEEEQTFKDWLQSLLL